MSLRPCPTVDDLLGDALIQAVMRADKVEPQTLKSLLCRAATRSERRRRGGESAVPAEPRPGSEAGRSRAAA